MIRYTGSHDGSIHGLSRSRSDSLSQTCRHAPSNVLQKFILFVCLSPETMLSLSHQLIASMRSETHSHQLLLALRHRSHTQIKNRRNGLLTEEQRIGDCHESCATRSIDGLLPVRIARANNAQTVLYCGRLPISTLNPRGFK